MRFIKHIHIACIFIGAFISTLPISASSFAQTQYQSTAKFNLNLSEEVREAVNHGVRLTFVCEFAKDRSWLFLAWQDVQKEHRFVVSYHALSSRYLVQRDSEQSPSLFRSLDGAMDFITAQSLTLLDTYNDTQHSYNLRVSLSKHELPGPMRLNAFISGDWSLDTGWISWQSER